MNTKFKSDRLNDPVIKYAGKNVVWLCQSQTAADAMAFLKKQNIADEIVYIYIVDDDERLVGVLPLRKLLNSDSKTRLSDIKKTSYNSQKQH